MNGCSAGFRSSRLQVLAPTCSECIPLSDALRHSNRSDGIGIPRQNSGSAAQGIFSVDKRRSIGYQSAQFSSRVAEGLALRSHGNPEEVAQGANSCPGRSGRDEKGTSFISPFSSTNDGRGFLIFVDERRHGMMGMCCRFRMF